MKITKKLHFKNRTEWRNWLEKNHDKEKEIWIIYYKKHTGNHSVPYNDAVEEALCFGWIDGIVKKLDEERYVQRYSPRNPKSLWSETNIKRVKKMVKEGKMTSVGLKLYKDAMKSRQIAPTLSATVPPDLIKALMKNKKAWGNFKKFPPSTKLMFTYWVKTAKTKETREKRIKRAVELSALNRKYPTMS